MISPAPASIADNKVYYFLGDFDIETGKFTPDENFDNKPALLDMYLVLCRIREMEQKKVQLDGHIV